MAKERLVKIVTPAGIARYPHLCKPDSYKGKTEYKVDLILDPANEEHAEFIERLTAASQEAYDKGIEEMKAELEEAKGKKKADLKKALESMEVHVPVDDEYDDDGETTGRKVVKFKCKAGGVYGEKHKKAGQKWKRDLPLFDSQKNELDPDELQLWGGSTLRVQAEMNPYCMPSSGSAGLSLRLYAVQVIEAVGGASDAGDGFGVEDGYVGEPKTNKPKQEEAPEEDDEVEDDEF